MRKAIIDLGTNTFNLLVADVIGNQIDVVFADKIDVAIGMGGINNKRLTEESILRGTDAIGLFLEKTKELAVETIHAFGTSALRDAENTDEFVSRIRDKFQLEVQIISGFKEAELIYHGVHQLYDFKEKGVIIDIGGGSTEIIFADNAVVHDVASLNIGVSRIYQKFELSDPLTLEDIQSIRNYLQTHSEGFLNHRVEPLMIGSSGSFETFWELIYLKKFPKEAKIYPLEIQIFKEVLEQTVRSTLEQRERNQFILPIHKLMAPITAVKMLWLMEKLKTTKIVISPYSLKEGALHSDQI
mgnify:FL=1